MPRSAPGALTGAPSSNTRPEVGASSPATTRSSVDLPQPDGPRIEMKSLSATVSVVGSSATVGGWPRPPGKMRLTASIASLLTGVPPRLRLSPLRCPQRGCTRALALRRSCEAPWKQPLVCPLEREIGHEADHADHDD